MEAHFMLKNCLSKIVPFMR